jgi:hypothetical protein
VAVGDNRRPLNEIDLTAALPASNSAGAIFEEFQPAKPLPFFDSGKRMILPLRTSKITTTR